LQGRAAENPPPPTKKQRAPPPPPPDDTTDDGTDDDNTTPPTAEEDDDASCVEEVFLDTDAAVLEDPAVLLDPGKWRAALATNTPQELIRALRGYYGDLAADRPHDWAFIADILLPLLRALALCPPAVAAPLVLCGRRLVARCEFHLSQKRLGSVNAASAAENDLLNRNLPKDVRVARRVAEKRAQQETKGAGWKTQTPSNKGRGTGASNRGRGQRQGGAQRQAGANNNRAPAATPSG
jgi:hypothetical protein